MKNGKTLKIIAITLSLLTVIILVVVYDMYNKKLEIDDIKLESKIAILIATNGFEFNKPCLMVDTYTEAIKLIKKQHNKDVEYYKGLGAAEVTLAMYNKTCEKKKKKETLMQEIREERENPTTYYKRQNY